LRIIISAKFKFTSANPVLLARMFWLINFALDRMFAAFHTPVSKWHALQIRLPFFEFDLRFLTDFRIAFDLEFGFIEVSGFTL